MSTPTPNQTPNAFAHPKLAELLRTASSTPFIGQILVGTVRDLVHPNDRVLACYSMIETSGANEDKEFTYYSIEVVLLTTAFLIRLNFFPKSHTVVKRRVHQISEIKVEYPAPPMDELVNINAYDFVPARVKLEVGFATDHGHPADTWVVEASDPPRVRALMEINRLLSRGVGVPLQQAAALILA